MYLPGYYHQTVFCTNMSFGVLDAKRSRHLIRLDRFAINTITGKLRDLLMEPDSRRKGFNAGNRRSLSSTVRHKYHWHYFFKCLADIASAGIGNNASYIRHTNYFVHLRRCSRINSTKLSSGSDAVITF